MLTTPGFWDLHLHGVAGIDFMHAKDDAMAAACEKLGALGTAAFAPTLLTAEPRLLREACARWGSFLERAAKPRFLARGAARPLGLHLEGPFLNPAMAGAHPPGHLKRPSRALAGDLIQAARGHVAIVTLAPELPGAEALIGRLSRAGIRVQLGHSNASAGVAIKAVRAGACGVTHLYNAMRIHHRDPGLLAPVARGLATAELITDGLHLDGVLVDWVLRAAPDQVYAVSDGCSAVASRPGARLTLGSLVLEKRGPAAVVLKSGVLAGAATPLSAHPARLAAALGERRVAAHFGAFFRIQRRLFPREARSATMKLHFDARSLRFLGCET